LLQSAPLFNFFQKIADARQAEVPKQNPCNTSMLQLNFTMWPSLGLIGVLQGGAKWTRLFALTFQQVLPCFRTPKQVFSRIFFLAIGPGTSWAVSNCFKNC